MAANVIKSSAKNRPRRRYPRFPMDIIVSLRQFGPGGLVELSGRSFQIGQNGIGVILAGEIEPGDVITLEFTMPGSARLLKLSALTRYRDGLRYGFEFLGSNEPDRETIRHACQLLAFAAEGR